MPRKAADSNASRLLRPPTVSPGTLQSEPTNNETFLDNLLLVSEKEYNLRDRKGQTQATSSPKIRTARPLSVSSYRRSPCSPRVLPEGREKLRLTYSQRTVFIRAPLPPVEPECKTEENNDSHEQNDATCSVSIVRTGEDSTIDINKSETGASESCTTWFRQFAEDLLEAWEPTDPQVRSDLLKDVEMYEQREERAAAIADLESDPPVPSPETVSVEDLGEDVQEDDFVPCKGAAGSLNTHLIHAESSDVTHILCNLPEVETSDVPSHEDVTIKDMGEDEEEDCFVARELHFLKTRTCESFSASGGRIDEVSERFDAVMFEYEVLRKEIKSIRKELQQQTEKSAKEKKELLKKLKSAER